MNARHKQRCPRQTGDILFIFALLFSPLIATSQVLPFESYTVKDGLLSNDIRCITQDSEGYLWFGTRDGASVFDGHQFTNYNVTDGLSPGFIQDIVEDCTSPVKSLWLLGARGMLSRWTHGVCERFLYDSTVSWMHRITSICVDHAGTLWAGTQDSLIQIVGGHVRPVNVGMSVRYPHLIREQGDSALWIASRSGLLRFDYATRRFEKIPLDTLDTSHINALLFGEHGEVWVGIDGGWILTLRHSSIVQRRKTLPFDFLTMDRRCNFWFGSYNGLYRIVRPSKQTSPVEHFSVENGLSENTMTEAFVDREGNLWLGGISKGIVKLSDDRVLRFPMKGINPPYQFSIAASDVNEHLWVIAGTSLWEIWRGSEGSWHRALHDNLDGRGTAQPFQVYDTRSKKDREIHPYSIFCARESTLWIVYSNAQIAAYAVVARGSSPSQTRLIRVLRAGEDVPHAFPKAMIVDHRGFIWYSNGSSIALLDPRRRMPLVREFREVPMWPGRNYARVLFEDRAGSIWAGFFVGGVMRLDGDSLLSASFHPVLSPDSGPEDGITSITQDSTGRVWIGTDGRGMLLVDHGNVRRVMVSHGLPSNTILSMAIEKKERIWIGTSVGICYVDHADPGNVIQPAQFQGEMAVQGGRTRSGLLWFAARSGLLIYDVRQDVLPVPPPAVSITSFQVNGEVRDTGRKITLLSAENNCSIGFVAPIFRDAGLVRYEFRLLGVDTTWSVPQRQRDVTFAALLPDTYTFEVRAVVSGTSTISSPTSVRFEIVPPFWKTWWFASLAWLAAAVVIAGAVRYVEKRKLMAMVHALELQQVLDRERLRVSQDMHDEVGSALTEIAVLSELAKQRPDSTGTYLNEISERAAEVIDSVSEIVWAMNPRNDTLDNVIAHIRRHAVKYLSTAEVRCRVSAPEVLPLHHLNAEARRNLFLVVKEALHNVVKHASASEVTLTLAVGGSELTLAIEDNGKGFLPDSVGEVGNGLLNMRKRLETIGGSCDILSVPGQGAHVVLRCPLATEVRP